MRSSAAAVCRRLSQQPAAGTAQLPRGAWEDAYVSTGGLKLRLLLAEVEAVEKYADLEITVLSVKL
jgi:hypothetical protein